MSGVILFPKKTLQFRFHTVKTLKEGPWQSASRST